MFIDTHTQMLLCNTKNSAMKKKINLPFSDDELWDVLRSIGVVQTRYTFDQLAYNEPEEEVEDEEYDVRGLFDEGKWKVESIKSDYLPSDSDKYIGDPFGANELIEKIELLDDSQSDLLDALLKDGYDLESAVTMTDDGDADFYPNTTLKDLAQVFNDEGLLKEEFLLEHIDWEGVARDLSFDGYREVAGGVLCVP
ncbi:MAG: hypothetical protein IKP68_06250 [Clostridia bacterium]|nr:hypothetical protein [Clostridia bacterium]